MVEDRGGARALGRYGKIKARKPVASSDFPPVSQPQHRINPSTILYLSATGSGKMTQRMCCRMISGNEHSCSSRSETTGRLYIRSPQPESIDASLVETDC